MTANSNDQFYTDLPIGSISLSTLLSEENLFHPIPYDWHVIITDIKDSTQAVLNGRHQDVNLIATGSIVTVLNIAFKMNITVPFFFGGDGATFIVPASLIDKLMRALKAYKTNTFNNFNLDLRTGTIPVSKIYGEGHEIRIAKFSRSTSFSIPVVLGSGLDYAEKVIKGNDYLLSDTDSEDPDLSGMQCRWDKIAPPENKEEIVTLLIIACKTAQQSAIFKKILEKMDELYGPPEKRQPISVAQLKLKTTFSRLSTEMCVRLGKIKWFELIKNWFGSLYGYIYFSTQNGKNYLKSLVEMSDTLVIDGRINTVITGTAAQRKMLQELLDTMEGNGEIIYGLHISNASIMSCYVRNLEDDHIHFVDGSEGGYTKAAKMLKAKLRL
ncbi:DUF3095 domain-containing protein [Flavobacterium cerinum]|uniref:DUF3095 domain-containing protein n=1 Tax=Flavobacterium cerinum TaxID=2502784 RepID=A0A3S4STP8_9FLAO|nr:DUF3095 domain-containing protein [Flavobacterium cerinum]RWW92217.1 DUF3095 domain-containing protein [Flavobacterium cerinum]